MSCSCVPQEVLKYLGLPCSDEASGTPYSAHTADPIEAMGAQVASELSRVPPSQLLVPCKQPWQGILSLERVVERLRVLLPPTFEDLPQEFAVGVVSRRGQHLLINSGPLPEAVAASAAIPFIFGPVSIPGASWPSTICSKPHPRLAGSADGQLHQSRLF